jgi:hypothetical protein
VELELLNSTEGPLPTAGETETATVTAPVSPKLFKAIFDMLDLPGTTLRLARLAVMLKSAFTLTVTTTKWIIPPFVPVTFTEYAPAGVAGVVATFRVAVAMFPPAASATITLVPVKEELLNNATGPLATTGETATPKVTLPARPFVLFRPIVDVPKDPATKDSDLGLAVTLKSSTFTGTKKECRRIPLASVTLTE